MKTPASRLNVTLWAIGIALILITNLKLFTTYKVVRWDAFDEMFTYFRWIGSALREGYFPDFFPNIVSGYPIGSIIQSGTYNIFYLTFAFIFPDSVSSVNSVYLVTQMVVFSLGFAIGRSYQFSSLTSIYFGLALTASGFVVGHASHFSYLATAAGLLGCFLALRLAAAQRASASFLLTSIAVYHIFTAGYPTNAFFGAICLALYWIYLFASIPVARRALLAVGAGVFLGLLLSTPAILHFLNLVQLSDRGEGLSLEQAMHGSLPQQALLNYFYPIWEVGLLDPTMERFHLIFISAPLTILALYSGLYTGKERARIIILMSVAIFAVLLALGSNSPVPIRPWLAENFYVFRTGRWPSGEHRGIGLFALVLLSAIGLQRLQDKWPQKGTFVLVIIALDFYLVMTQLMPLRIAGMPDEYKGQLPRYEVQYGARNQHLIDAPRNCAPNGKSRGMTTSQVQRDLAPSGFYWEGYVGLVDLDYDLERHQYQNILCGPSRLWKAVNESPHPYGLITYTPGYIKLTVFGDIASGESRFVWSDYNDGFWRLKINGESATFLKGPAKTRAFSAAPGDTVEMVYAGPLSQLWRK
jgi:hypothetical protein